MKRARSEPVNNSYDSPILQLVEIGEDQPFLSFGEPREQFKIPRRDRSGDTLFIGEPICGLWQRGRTRRVSTKMVTIDTGDTPDPGHWPERRARRTPLALITHHAGNILAPVIIGCRAR